MIRSNVALGLLATFAVCAILYATYTLGYNDALHVLSHVN